MRLKRALTLCVVVTCSLAGAQTLLLPPRPVNALAGREFASRIKTLSLADREQLILRQILSGNVPGFLRHLCPVRVTNLVEGRTNSATFFVTPDYLCVGTDDDFFFTPMTPATAQRIADQLDCALPTRKMVDQIYRAAEVKLAPVPIPPSAAMTTVPVFLAHNDLIWTQRRAFLTTHPLGALVAGDKKDVVISRRLATLNGRVAIYGWHRTNGIPIQPLYLGHSSAWVDYSQGIRLVQQRMILNGTTTTVAQVLADPKPSSLLSDEDVITNSQYSTNQIFLFSGTNGLPTGTVEFKPTGQFGERVASFVFEPEVKIQINVPAAKDFAPNKPVLLIFYALPNGNSIAQTIGHQLQQGDDWHFGIQQIGAQTRFLRGLITNRAIVVAYLEAESKSWPAWRKKHGDHRIPEIIDRVKSCFPTNRLEIALTSHSGGGSFIFGYLNTIDQIPADIVRIAFLDSDYAYDSARGQAEKLTRWLKSSDSHFLCVLAYDDAAALLNGKPFVSAHGGTWGRSHAFLKDLSAQFYFTNQTNSEGLEICRALAGRIQFLLKENPNHEILHTVQVERNGFIHALVTGTPAESNGYDYFGKKAYERWILPQ